MTGMTDFAKKTLEAIRTFGPIGNSELVELLAEELKDNKEGNARAQKISAACKKLIKLNLVVRESKKYFAVTMPRLNPTPPRTAVTDDTQEQPTVIVNGVRYIPEPPPAPPRPIGFKTYLRRLSSVDTVAGNHIELTVEAFEHDLKPGQNITILINE
jgi:hypothetical protein